MIYLSINYRINVYSSPLYLVVKKVVLKFIL